MFSNSMDIQYNTYEKIETLLVKLFGVFSTKKG